MEWIMDNDNAMIMEENKKILLLEKLFTSPVRF